MDNKKQTAVEWLVEQYKKSFTLQINDVMTTIIEQAKAMEKEQMKDAVLSQCTTNEGLRKIFENQFEQYYSETYEK